jgi:hypothetical protein
MGLVRKYAEASRRHSERDRAAHPAQVVGVQRIAAIGGSEARPAIGIAGPVDARVVIVSVAAAGGAWRLFSSVVVVVGGGMAMHAGAVIVVVDLGVPMSPLGMPLGMPVGITLDVVPVNEQRVPGIGNIARVGMRMVMANTVAETHRVRMGVAAVPVRVTMLDETRGDRADRQPDDDGEGGAANAVRHASTQEADGSVHRTALATIPVDPISRSRLWQQAPLPESGAAARACGPRTGAAENGH